jgi:hypothetical protein
MNGVLVELTTTNTDLERQTKQVNITFTTNADASPSQVLKVISRVDKDNIANGLPLFNLVVEKEISDSAAEILIYEDVNLKRSVPGVTFGKLITELKNNFNIEVSPIGKDIYMNFIEDEINFSNAIDLRNFEVLEPKREFNKLDSLLLKFKEPSSEFYSFLPVYQDKEQLLYNENLVSDHTETIEVDILPLVQKNVDGIESAFNFDEGGEDKIYFCLYDGLQDNLNVTIDPQELQLPNIYNKYHKKWFTFRLISILYNWLFKMYLEDLTQINKKVFAYGRFHVVKSIEKTQLSEDLFEVEIETETLP